MPAEDPGILDSLDSLDALDAAAIRDAMRRLGWLLAGDGRVGRVGGAVVAGPLVLVAAGRDPGFRDLAARRARMAIYPAVGDRELAGALGLRPSAVRGYRDGFYGVAPLAGARRPYRDAHRAGRLARRRLHPHLEDAPTPEPPARPPIPREAPMSDPTETIRRARQAEINRDAAALAEAEPDDPRAAFERRHGRVWDTGQLQEDFTVEGFAAPLVVVTRRADGVRGSLEFSHAPRFYFNFQPHGG